jgi:DNA-binding CsgD family transcriptional regulator/tetratricopeptide (TPR) repeat protein
VPIFGAGLVQATNSDQYRTIATQIRTGDATQPAPPGDRGLLERSTELRALEKSLLGARDGRGSLVLASGEAGVGKTALVRAFCAAHEESARVLWGACDPLFAPRPLGPLLDFADAVGGELAELVHAGARPHDVTMALRRELGQGRPAILVFEDAQWADEATLDVLRLLSGRLDGMRATVVVTYRDDDLDRWHPLRMVLGEIGASRVVTRLRLMPLSPEAVASLAADHDADPAELYRRTGGNPFFVTEVLASGNGGIPDTVRGAVLARAARLSPEARAVLEAIAVIPPEAELWLLDALVGDAGEPLQECISSGMVRLESGAVGFRHELARLAIEAEIEDHRKRELHRAAGAALAAPPAGEPDLARLAHHADAADDAEALLEFAPAAAGRASQLGAHREAASLYGRALRLEAQIPLELRAKLFEGRAVECFLTVQLESAVDAQRRAVEAYRELDDQLRVGDTLRFLAHLVWQFGALADAQEIALRAATGLEEIGPTPKLVSAYCQVAQLLIAAEELEDALAWAERALDLAEQLGDPVAVAEAHRTIGWIDLLEGRDGAVERLERCIEVYEDAGLEADVAAIPVIIVRTAARRRLWELTERYIRAGLDYCDGRDFDIWRYYLISWQAKLELARGRWDEAAQCAEISLGEPCPFARIHALVALGLVRARRGDADPWTPFDEALELAMPRHELQWIAPVAIARAEAAWLEGRHDAVMEATEAALEFSRQQNASYTTGLVYWQWRAGMDAEVPLPPDDPQALEIAGDWRAAVARWEELGCPYEAALARLDSDDEGALRVALESFHELGARPAAAIVARRLRERGVRGLPRGPRPATRDNPAGLTARELEVLSLLTEHLTNAEIAERLVVSERTVDHHVSAVLRKLDVRSRGEAGAVAVQRGLAGPL